MQYQFMLIIGSMKQALTELEEALLSVCEAHDEMYHAVLQSYEENYREPPAYPLRRRHDVARQQMRGYALREHIRPPKVICRIWHQ